MRVAVDTTVLSLALLGRVRDASAADIEAAQRLWWDTSLEVVAPAPAVGEVLAYAGSRTGQADLLAVLEVRRKLRLAPLGKHGARVVGELALVPHRAAVLATRQGLKWDAAVVGAAVEAGATHFASLDDRQCKMARDAGVFVVGSPSQVIRVLRRARPAR